MDELYEQAERDKNRRFGVWLLVLLVIFGPAVIYALPTVSGPFWIFVAPVVSYLLVGLSYIGINMARTGSAL